MIKWTFLVFALLGLQVSLAMKLFRGACPPNMTATGDFDMQRFIGKWYTYSRYDSIPPISVECQSVEYKPSENSFFIESRQINSKTDTVLFQKAEIKNIEAQKGRYIQDTKNKAFPEGVQIYILDTDYENYAIRFMCFDSSGIFSFHWASIEFRKRLPPKELLHKVETIANESGVVVSEMAKVKQVACPHDT